MPSENEDRPELLVPLWRLRSHPEAIHIEYDRPPECIHMFCSLVIWSKEQVEHSRQPVSRVRSQATQMCPSCLEGMEHALKHFGVLDATTLLDPTNAPETTTREENDR